MVWEKWVGVLAPIAALVFMVLACVGCVGIDLWVGATLGVDGFGPDNTYKDVRVLDTYVDVNGETSSYMVVFELANEKLQVAEVDNSVIFNMRNADVVYSTLKQAKVNAEYVTVCLRGNQVTNLFIQQYPYVKNLGECKDGE